MIDEALRELLRPVVREVVREELGRERQQERWLPAAQAADKLGISAAATRMRVKRGQLPGKTVDGRVYVDMAAFNDRLDALP